MSFAREVGNRVLFIDDDIIVEKGTPQEIFFNAQNERTKLFLSKILWYFNHNSDELGNKYWILAQYTASWDSLQFILFRMMHSLLGNAKNKPKFSY